VTDSNHEPDDGALGRAGLLSGADLTLDAELPSAPADVPAYRATAEEALAWARDLGLSDPRIYRNPNEPGATFVVGTAGRGSTFRPGGGPAGSVYYGDERAVAVIPARSLHPFREIGESRSANVTKRLPCVSYYVESK